MSFKTADLCDEYSSKLQMIGSQFKSFGKSRRFHGPMYTVRVLDDNVLVKQALESIPAGSVLVVDGGASHNCALLGDRLAEIAYKRQLAGVIIYGCVRDSHELGQMDIGILALGTHPCKSIKKGLGEQGIPLQFFSVEWKPGEYVYVDEDGIVISSDKLI